MVSIALTHRLAVAGDVFTSQVAIPRRLATKAFSQKIDHDAGLQWQPAAGLEHDIDVAGGRRDLVQRQRDETAGAQVVADYEGRLIDHAQAGERSRAKGVAVVGAERSGDRRPHRSVRAENPVVDPQTL